MRSAWQTRQADQKAGGEIGLVVLCFLAFRLFALLLFQYGGVFGSGSDFDYYYAMAQQTDHGFWPYLSYWSEYPPVFPWLIVSVYRFTALFGGSPSSSTFIHLLHGVLLTFDLGNLLLIYALARRIYGKVVALRSAWVYATLFAPIFVWLGWFDPMPIFWMLLSLWLLVRRNAAWAGFACGIGIVTKIFPGFVALVVLREAIGVRPTRRGIATVLTFAIPCALALGLVCLPFAVANPVIFVTSVRSWFSRLPWESFWAIADGYYLFGIVPSLPSRIGWPTYTTPALSSPMLGTASLLVLAGSVVGVYLKAWDGTPESGEGMANDPWTIARAISLLRRIAWGWSVLAIRAVTLFRQPRPPALATGLEVVGSANVADISAPLIPIGSVGATVAAQSNDAETIDESQLHDERAFRLVAFAAVLYVATFLVTSGYSPQFMLWMVPFAVILLPSLEAFAWVTVFTLVVIVGERYLYYWYFPPDAPVLAAIVLMRSLLLAGFLGEILWQIGVPRAEVWQRVRKAVIVMTGVTLLAVSGLMLKTFADGGWGAAVALDPARVASSQLRRTTDKYDAVLAFTDADYRWLGPWLGDRAFYLLTASRFATSTDVEQTMREVARAHSAVVVLDRGSPTASERAAADWLQRYGTELSSSVDKSGLRTTRYEIVPGLAWPAAPPTVATNAVFANDVQLLGYSITSVEAKDTPFVALDLYWKPLRRVGPADMILTPSGAGAYVGQIGSTYPSSDWEPGEVVVDRESIPATATSLTIAWRSRATGELLGSATIQLRPNR